jgi:hypothetical protein
MGLEMFCQRSTAILVLKEVFFLPMFGEKQQTALCQLRQSLKSIMIAIAFNSIQFNSSLSWYKWVSTWEGISL